MDLTGSLQRDMRRRLSSEQICSYPGAPGALEVGLSWFLIVALIVIILAMVAFALCLRHQHHHHHSQGSGAAAKAANAQQSKAPGLT